MSKTEVAGVLTSDEAGEVGPRRIEAPERGEDPTHETRVRQLWRQLQAAPVDPELLLDMTLAASDALRQRTLVYNPKAVRAAAQSKRPFILVRDGYRCQWCGFTGTETDMEVDHIVPVEYSGSSRDVNLQTLCQACNRKKRATAQVIHILITASQKLAQSGDLSRATVVKEMQTLMKDVKKDGRWIGANRSRWGLAILIAQAARPMISGGAKQGSKLAIDRLARAEEEYRATIDREDWELRRADWLALRDELAPEILKRDGYRCQLCGATAGPFDALHHRPLYLGGTSDPENLQTACQQCSGKRTRELAAAAALRLVPTRRSKHGPQTEEPMPARDTEEPSDQTASHADRP